MAWSDDLVYYFLSKADQGKLADSHPTELKLYHSLHASLGNLRKCEDRAGMDELEDLCEMLKKAAKAPARVYTSPTMEAMHYFLNDAEK